METLERLSKASNEDPTGFWAAATIVCFVLLLAFFGFTVYFLKRYLDEDKEDKKEIRNNLIRLTDIVTRMQENQKTDRRDINKNTDDINELRKNKPRR